LLPPLGEGWDGGFSASCFATAVCLIAVASSSHWQASSFLCATKRKQKAQSMGVDLNKVIMAQ
ncbi:MAG: hypothetical protein Q4B46_05620, partial [Comamonadaceae bacterium]|nr:hypothetical protein [Comamonadaceae bacterium]